MKHKNPSLNLDKKPAPQILAIAILSLIFTLPITARSTGHDLAGTYAVGGADAEGRNYQGEMVITRRDEVYQLSWKIGTENYDGVAVQSGSTLAAAYTVGTDGTGCGAVVYKINPDNSLDGAWGEWGVN